MFTGFIHPCTILIETGFELYRCRDLYLDSGFSSVSCSCRCLCWSVPEEAEENHRFSTAERRGSANNLSFHAAGLIKNQRNCKHTEFFLLCKQDRQRGGGLDLLLFYYMTDMCAQNLLQHVQTCLDLWNLLFM